MALPENKEQYVADAKDLGRDFTDDLGATASQRWLRDLVTEMHAQDDDAAALAKAKTIIDKMLAEAADNYFNG